MPLFHNFLRWIAISLLNLLIAVQCIASAAAGSENTAPVPPVQMAFRHILPDAVEAVGYITSIAQDQQGFMWFGGHNGLARYDGYQLKVYKHNPEVPGSLSHNYVTKILSSRRGDLWVAAQTGLSRYNRESDTFTLFRNEAGPLAETANDIRSMLEDSRQRLWLATAGGLSRFEPESGRFVRYPYGDSGERVILSIAEDAEGHLWLGEHNGGLTRFHPDRNSLTHYRHDPTNSHSLSHNDVRKVYIDRQDNLWVGTHGGGLNRLGPDRKKFQRFAFDPSNKSDLIWDILQDNLGNLWIGDGGAVGFLPRNASSYQRFSHRSSQPTSPGNHVVNVLYADRAGDIWVGYFPSGVDIVDHQASAFRNYVHDEFDPQSLSDGGILSTWQDESGALWIGTGYGLSRMDRAAERFTSFRHQSADSNSLSGDTVLSIAGDADGYLWLGIWSGGLTRYDPRTGQFRRYQPDGDNPRGLLGSEPWAMTVTRDGVLWVATERGINRYNRTTDDFTHFLPPPQEGEAKAVLYSRAILEDSRGQLWIGSIRGLYRLNPASGQFEHFGFDKHDPHSLSDDYVRALYEDSRGRLWVGTHGGLNLYDPSSGRFRAYRQADGLPDEVVTGIVEDGEGSMWASTQKGLARLHPDSGRFRVYDTRHGLPGNLFNGNTALRLSSGELVFGSSKGLTIFDPLALRENLYMPPVVITDFEIFNKPVPIGGNSPLQQAPHSAERIELTHEHSVVSFTFAALNYRSPEENRYAYRLVGFDSDWHQVGKQRTATYTNLDPGNYTFRVRGSNDEGVWNHDGIAIALHVAPPLWQTWWAYTLYVLSGAILIYLVLYLFLKKHAYEREHTLNRRLQDLDKLKDQFLAHTSHELRTPLNGIIGLSESLLDGLAGPVPEPMQKHLSMIAFSGKRLARLVDDILDFSKLKTHSLELNLHPLILHGFVEEMIELTGPLSEGKRLELVNRVPDDLPPVLVDENRLRQIFYNLLGNAIKFTDRGSITVSASPQGKQTISVEVTDTGAGIPGDQIEKVFQSFEQGDGSANRKYGGTGLGLAITRQLVELHGGRITVKSTLGQGTSFRITLPVARERA